MICEITNRRSVVHHTLSLNIPSDSSLTTLPFFSATATVHSICCYVGQMPHRQKEVCNQYKGNLPRPEVPQRLFGLG